MPKKSHFNTCYKYTNYKLDCKIEHCTCCGRVTNIGGTAYE